MRDKQKHKETRHKYYLKNKEVIKEKVRKYKKDNKEKVNAYCKKWSQQNRESYLGIKQRSYKVQKAKGRNVYWVVKRNKVVKRQTPQTADQEKIKEFYVLSAKLSRETGIKHEVDHIVPLQGKTVSGFHAEWNLQVLPQLINRKKYNKLGGQ